MYPTYEVCIIDAPVIKKIVIVEYRALKEKKEIGKYFNWFVFHVRHAFSFMWSIFFRAEYLKRSIDVESAIKKHVSTIKGRNFGILEVFMMPQNDGIVIDL